jgi:hypothetical protein
MVTVTDYKLVESEEGDLYVRLILTGDIAMVQSSKTGNFYATARRCSISATFDEAAAEQMLGKQIPGNIIKQECKPYSYETDSGELIELSHRWVYTDKSDEELAISELVTSASKNGTTEVEELA